MYITFVVVFILLFAGRMLIAVASLRCVSSVNHDGCVSSYNLSSEYLGYTYEVLMWPEDGHDAGQASFSVVTSASTTSTKVRARFPPGSARCVIEFGAVRLDCGQTVDFTLLGAETATFTSTTADLSGTLVEASAPVAVYAANSHVTIGPSNITDSTSEQLFPLSAWGREFVVAPVPDNGQSGYSLRVTCARSVNVSIDVAGVVHQLTRQRPLTVDFPDNRPAYVNVVDGSAVQLVQFVRGATSPADGGAPAALVVPAVNRFNDVYSLTTSSGYVDYVSIVTRRTDVGGLRLNDQPLSVSSAWLNVDGRTDWVTAAVPLPAATSHTLEHAGRQQFGAYRYGYVRGQCAYAQPAGASLPRQVINSPVHCPRRPWSRGYDLHWHLCACLFICSFFLRTIYQKPTQLGSPNLCVCVWGT